MCRVAAHSAGERWLRVKMASRYREPEGVLARTPEPSSEAMSSATGDQYVLPAHAAAVAPRCVAGQALAALRSRIPVHSRIIT